MSVRFQCRVCRGRISQEDMDLDLGVLRCPQCQAVSRSAEVAGTASMRPPVPLPRRMRLWETKENLVIAVRWFHPKCLLAVALVAIFDAAIYFGYPRVLAEGAHWTGLVFGAMAYNVLFLLGSYWVMALLLNRTHVTVRRDRLTVRHFPLPLYRWSSIRTSDVAQIFCREDTGQQLDLPSFRVCVLLKNDRWQTLVQRLRTVDQALFVEQAIERHLGIQDHPVAGEIDR